MNTQCSHCSVPFDLSPLYQGGRPTCPGCRPVIPDILIPSIVPPIVEIIPNKTINWDDFKQPIMCLKTNVGSWNTCDFRHNKIIIDPFDPKMIRKIFIAQHYVAEIDDEHEWILVFERFDMVCVIFKAKCAIIDFTSESGGTLMYADNFPTFWCECLDDETQKIFCAESIKSPNQLVLTGFVLHT